MIGADALSVSAQAAKTGTPILLTRADLLEKESEEFLKDHDIKNVTIIGGEKAVSKKVIDKLSTMGIKTEVLFGADRFKTSKVVNQKYFPNADEIYLANGINGADALTISPKAGADTSAIQLIRKDSISEDIQEYLKSANPEKVFVLGGTAAIDDNNKFRVEALYQ